MTPRLMALLQMVETDPGDAETLYMVGLECKAIGQTDLALQWFQRALNADANYVAASYQAGVVLRDAGRIEEAQRAVEAGILRCQRGGNKKMLHELEALRDELA